MRSLPGSRRGAHPPQPCPAGLYQGHNRLAREPLLRHRHPGVYRDARQVERPRQTRHLHDRRESRLHEGRQQEPPPQPGYAQHYGRIHAWDRGTRLLAHGQLCGDVDSGKNGIPKGNVQNRMMEVREVTLEMVPSETDERVPPLALRETSLPIYPVETVLVAVYGGFNRIGRTGLLKIRLLRFSRMATSSMQTTYVRCSTSTLRIGRAKRVAHFRQSEVTRLVLLAYHEVCG